MSRAAVVGSVQGAANRLGEHQQEPNMWTATIALCDTVCARPHKTDQLSNLFHPSMWFPLGATSPFL